MRRRETVREDGVQRTAGRCRQSPEAFELASGSMLKKSGQGSGKRNAVCGYPQIGILRFSAVIGK